MEPSNPEVGGARNEAWAPAEIFESILRYSVVPTFDLILESVEGILLVRRCISPYKGLWALPGLRIFKGESIAECLARIALDEVGLRVNPAHGTFINQATVKFRTDNERQDLSTCYAFELEIDDVMLNNDHLSAWMFIRDMTKIPVTTGGLYKEHLNRYFEMRDAK